MRVRLKAAKSRGDVPVTHAGILGQAWRRGPLTATTLLIKPNANSRRARNRPGPMRRAALPGRQSAAQPAGPRAGLALELSRPRRQTQLSAREPGREARAP